MKTDEIVDLIDEHLQEVNKNKEERIKRIKEMQDFLAYNLRISELTERELDDLGRTMEGVYFTDNMRKTLDDCKTEERKNYYIEMWARSTYFKQCAWMSYLHGECSDKPFVQ